MQLLQISASDLQKFLEATEELLKEFEEIQIAIASFPDTPRSLLEILVNSNYSSVVEAARLHVNLAGTLEDYQDVAEVLQNLDLGQNDRLAVELMQFAPVAACFLSEWVPVTRLIQGLQNKYMPLRYRLQLLERLAVSEKLEARLVVAESSEAPSLLELLAGDLELAVRLTVECNDNCPLEIVELVKSQHDLANDWDADVEQLRELGESRWSWIRLAVAQNPFAPEDVLMKLATDEFSKTRLAVGKNPNTTSRVLGVLAEELDKEIQAAVVEHPNIGEETLHKLFAGYKSEIEKRKDLPRSILERFFREKEYKNVYLFFSNDNTPIGILAELANIDLEELTAKAIDRRDSSPIIETLEHWIESGTNFLTEIAEHPQASVDILQHLMQYPNPDVKLAIAENPKTPEELRISLLQQLSIDSKANIRIKIVSNPQTPITVLEQLANASYKLDGTIDLLRELAPDITPNLLKQIKTFIYKCQSPEMVIMDLGQSSPNSIFEALEEWNHLVDSFNESERETLEYLANQESPLDWEGRYTARRRSKRRREPSFSNDELAKNYSMLDGLMHLVNTQYNRDRTNQEVVAALLGNPSVPIDLRERLWERYKTTPDDESEYLEDWDMRMAVAFNPQTSKEQRIEYLQQLLAYEVSHIGSYVGYKIYQSIAKNSLTPEFILEFILQNRRGSIRDVIKNPNAPVSIFRQAAQEDSSSIEELIFRNPNTPKYILQEIASRMILLININSTPYEKYIENDRIELLLKHPKLNPLDVYKIELKLEARKQTLKAHQLVEKRSDNHNTSPRNTFSPLQTPDITPTLQSLPRIYNPETDDLPTLLTEYVQSNNPFVRFVTLLHPITPQEILTQAANSASWLERYAVAENESTPLEARSILARDGNRIVRAAANQSL